jgi:hypothetical protein
LSPGLTQRHQVHTLLAYFCRECTSTLADAGHKDCFTSTLEITWQPIKPTLASTRNNPLDPHHCHERTSTRSLDKQSSFLTQYEHLYLSQIKLRQTTLQVSKIEHPDSPLHKLSIDTRAEYVSTPRSPLLTTVLNENSIFSWLDPVPSGAHSTSILLQGMYFYVG